MKTSAASITGSKLSSGSPMPMKTILVMPRVSPRRARYRATRQAWPTISARLRLPPKPCLPVAQKLQSKAQPAWEEMHSVRRDASSASADSGISTVSTTWPLPTAACHFTTASPASWLLASMGARISAMSASRARNALERSVMAPKSSTKAWYIHFITWLAR